jgi:hypothetical protein
MFFDWLNIYQEFEQEIPIVGSRAYMNIDVETGEGGTLVQPSWQHKGSYSTSINIRISGNCIEMSGNPSRYGRIENLFGLTSLDECVSVYNRILRSLGLPEFTKCTKVWQVTEKQNGSAKFRTFSDGAVIKELHITTNRAVGKGCADDYLKGLSTLNYRNSVPRLHTNGKTVDWLSKKGAANLIYPSVYDKANELRLHTLDKIKRACGETSDEYRYLLSVIEYCEQNGVVRFEQKIKGRQLTRMNARYWGLFSDQIFKPLHEEFLNIDERLQVTSMTIEGISERLLRLGIVDTTRAANTTALYAIQWMHGQKFDSGKSQVQQHRARLRKIGIDICSACNISRVSPVYIRKAKEVTVTALDDAPSWYRHAKTAHLKLVA